jgi:hypothetical protein
MVPETKFASISGIHEIAWRHISGIPEILQYLPETLQWGRVGTPCPRGSTPSPERYAPSRQQRRVTSPERYQGILRGALAGVKRANRLAPPTKAQALTFSEKGVVGLSIAPGGGWGLPPGGKTAVVMGFFGKGKILPGEHQFGSHRGKEVGVLPPKYFRRER